jgi:hypothetical protein
MLATVAPPHQTPRRKKETIPAALIYEIIDGRPIYYQGYREVLNKQKKIGEIIGSSRLQVRIIMAIISYLLKRLDEKKYEVATNEFGIHIDKGNNFSTDIGIFELAALQASVVNNKCFDIPPKIVFEIDTDADLEFLEDGLYFHTKTQKLLDFGVEKVIWYFTKSEKVMVASPHQSWTTDNWGKTVEVFDDIKFSLTELLTEKGISF